MEIGRYHEVLTPWEEFLTVSAAENEMTALVDEDPMLARDRAGYAWPQTPPYLLEVCRR